MVKSEQVLTVKNYCADAQSFTGKNKHYSNSFVPVRFSAPRRSCSLLEIKFDKTTRQKLKMK